MKRLIFVLFIVLVLLALFALPALAQEVPPPTPDLPVIPLDQAANLLIATIVSILIGLVDSPITTFFVALLKHIPALNVVPARTLQFVVAGIVTVIYWLTSYLGYGVQFNTVIGVLLAIAPALAGLFARQTASAATYHVMKAANVGFVGYQRPAFASGAKG